VVSPIFQPRQLPGSLEGDIHFWGPNFDPNHLGQGQAISGGVFGRFFVPTTGMISGKIDFHVVRMKAKYLWYTGWWFGFFFIFPNGWDDDPIWRIFFRGVETTNQYMMIYVIIYVCCCMLYVSCFETETGREQPAIGCYRYIMVPDLLMGIQLEFVKWWLGMVSWGMSVYPILIHIWYISWYRYY